MKTKLLSTLLLASLYLASCQSSDEQTHISSVFYPIMQKAGIDKTKGDKKGFHSFRRMLGGLLLESGTDFPLISQILGHSDTSTVARYMPFGMEALEICVMDLPSMGGGKEAGS